jgi:hypothetical protein
MGCPFRDLKRTGDAHFCPLTCSAPYTESRTDTFCPRKHPAKTPMRIALFLSGFGIDSAAVVTNEQSQDVVQVRTSTSIFVASE